MEAYQNVFENQRIWTGYRNTVFYTIFGTVLNLALTNPPPMFSAKSNCRRATSLRGLFDPHVFQRRLDSHVFARARLHLLNTAYTIVVLGGLSIYNMVVTRTYFSNSIPGELYESAKIDGATEFTNFFQIALPLRRRSLQ